MGVQENILLYILLHGKENKYRLASALRVGVNEIIEALNALEEEGKIRMEGGRAMLAKGKKPKEELEEELEESKEEPVGIKATEEQPTEVSEEPTEEEIPEHFGVKEEEKIEGTVKFFNPKKGFGFITGDDGKDYYVNESGLKEGVAIKADDRVSFKVVQETQGLKAEEVEKIEQSAEE